MRFRTSLLIVLLLTRAVAADPPPVRAVINYSVAPWDGLAYSIEISLKSGYIHIDLWGNPTFNEPRTFRFSRHESQEEGGRASFQLVLNKSWPAQLVGTVTFRALQAGHPVEGSYALEKSDGTRLEGRFQAVWGKNKPPRYIR